MAKFQALFLFVLLITVSKSASLYELADESQPQVAVRCGKVPAFLDTSSGEWRLWEKDVQMCDENKEDVLSLCRQVYPLLNISNIVEANSKVTINPLCSGSDCEVIPYRCLVVGFDSDALVVPVGCKFQHMYFPETCISHDEWKAKVEYQCLVDGMILKDYGILLPCATDRFSGAEYVCCLNDPVSPASEDWSSVGKLDFEAALSLFKSMVPEEKLDCDRSFFDKLKAQMESRHRDYIATLVGEWQKAEESYKNTRLKDVDQAKKNMKQTIQMFRSTMDNLRKDWRTERRQLQSDKHDCTVRNINFRKRTAMLDYVAKLTAEPRSADAILQTLKRFIQICEHDRVHSLKYFDRVRNQNPDAALGMRASVLQRLVDLNNLVNQSTNLLSFLPDVAQLFGLQSPDDSTYLKPKTGLDSTVAQDPYQDPFLKGMDDHEAVVESDTESESNTPSTDVTRSPAEVDTAMIDSVNSSEPFNIGVDPNVPLSDGLMPPMVDTNDREMLGSPPTDFPDLELPETVMPEEEDRSMLQRSHQYTRFNGANNSWTRNRVLFLSLIIVAVVGILGVVTVVTVLVIQRQRASRMSGSTSLLVVGEEQQDRAHMAKMQKKGFENPTYKFYL